MEQAEIELLVAELEVRLDRLRALYDQYFMGIERLEPTVVKRDIDRRLDTLRKQQIRNTGLRFRFQTLVQRYNTYQTYWQRICRRIEEGTFKRDILRANRRFATTDPPPAPTAPSPRAEPAAAVPHSLADCADVDIDVDLDALFDEVRPQPRGETFEPPPGTRCDGGGVKPDTAQSKAAAGPPGPPPRLHDRTGRTDDASNAGTATGGDGSRPASAVRTLPSREGAPALRIRLAAPPPAREPQAAASRAVDPSPSAGRAELSSSAGRTPPATPGPPKPSPKAPPPPPPPGGGAALGEDQLRQVYARYIETRRARREPTASVTYESLAKTLRESAARLREKHGAGRSIDFEVIVKDGQTIIRPIVK